MVSTKALHGACWTHLLDPSARHKDQVAYRLSQAAHWACLDLVLGPCLPEEDIRVLDGDQLSVGEELVLLRGHQASGVHRDLAQVRTDLEAEVALVHSFDPDIVPHIPARNPHCSHRIHSHFGNRHIVVVLRTVAEARRPAVAGQAFVALDPRKIVVGRRSLRRMPWLYAGNIREWTKVGGFGFQSLGEVVVKRPRTEGSCRISQIPPREGV